MTQAQRGCSAAAADVTVFWEVRMGRGSEGQTDGERKGEREIERGCIQERQDSQKGRERDGRERADSDERSERQRWT